MNDEPMMAELALLYNHKNDDSYQFTRWQMIVAIAHGMSLADKALTTQLTEARESERAAEDRAWQQARELVRGTNADMCKTAEQAYRIICEEMTNAVNSRELRTLEGRVAALRATRQTGESA